MPTLYSLVVVKGMDIISDKDLKDISFSSTLNCFVLTTFDDNTNTKCTYRFLNFRDHEYIISCHSAFNWPMIDEE